MTRDDFQRIALSLPESAEGEHLRTRDFRVRNRIFATFGPHDPRLGVVKLTPDQQDVLCSSEPTIFAPIPGGWGRKGWTHVTVDAADEATLKSALTMAWGNVAPKKLLLPLKRHSGEMEKPEILAANAEKIRKALS